MNKVLLLSTGGTIASIVTAEGLSPGRHSNELLDYVPEVKSYAEVTTLDVMEIDSSNMQPENWMEIAGLIKENYRDYDGFVITHGTDTLAYTSSAMTYMLNNLSKPVVFTGSQKPIEDSQGDARRNLIDAIRFACENIAGVFVVFNGKVINGTRAKKTKSQSYDAFQSVNYPVIADLLGDYVKYREIASRSGSLNVSSVKGKFYVDDISPDVSLLKLIPGTKPEVFSAIAEYYRGIVIESFGMGGLPFKGRDLTKAISDLTNRGVIVALTTQVHDEGARLDTYQVGRKAEELQVISGEDMTPEALVTKLMWALSKSDDRETIKELIHTAKQDDIYSR